MAWPVNARYLSGVPNVTRIPWALLNAIQDAIYGGIGGIKTFLSLHVDGVGDQAASAAAGQLKVEGAADSAANLEMPTIATGSFKLIERVRLSTGPDVYQRRYAYKAASLVYRTVNASWNGVNWDADTVGLPSYAMVEGSGTVFWVYNGGVTPFAAWTAAHQVDPYAPVAGGTNGLQLGGPFKTTGSIAASTQAVHGETYKENVCVGWAKVRANGTVDDNFNLHSIAHVGGSGLYTLVFKPTVANAPSCAPVATLQEDAQVAGWMITAKGTAATTVPTVDVVTRKIQYTTGGPGTFDTTILDAEAPFYVHVFTR